MNSDETSTRAEAAEQHEGQFVVLAPEVRGSAIVLPVAGDVDMVTAPRFEAALAEAVARQPNTLVVDLSKVDFFASAGLSALVNAYRSAGSETALCVVASNTATARPLQVTALDRKIPVFASREQALAAL